MDFQQWIAPEQYNISSEIDRHKSDKIALRWTDGQSSVGEISYDELLKRVNQLAGGLDRLGLVKGDRVLVMVPRQVEAYVIYIACLKLGLVIIPSSEMLRAKDLSFRLNHSEARAVIAWAEGTREVDSITEELPYLRYRIDASGQTVDGWQSMQALTEGQPVDREAVRTHRDDMAILAYTSGTTGNPKGVVHSHGWGYAHLRITSSWLDIRETDLVWATAAPGWQKWIWTPFLSVLGSGATGFIYQGAFHAEKYLELIQSNKIVVMCCTPTEYRIMAKSDALGNYDLSSLRSTVSAGEPLNQAVINKFQELFGFIIRDGYGQTESTLLIGNLKDEPVKLGAMGKSIADGLVEIIDDEGRPLPAGEVGSIAVHGAMPALFHEYYRDPQRKPYNMVGSYFITGDRASRDEDGYFWFEGRGDDIIISSGYTIGPFEVEEALLRHPAVKECAAVASPDEIRGHVVKAFIVLKDESAASPALVKELQDHVKSWTAPYKYPRKIEFISDLPKTNSGKIRRIELREREARNQ
ncbi:acetyl-CoA synthetase [Paenibacillus cellulosilyticus]|uniref:Acetyl-CoA synthetase n=1 Tax=Paenibacillus cellulosilyticus TaxID=375489 RepID=A0A2V2YUW0_9BACL|nr:AMP-binding protein [Paenibacillus cellulosilyticus]PWW04885.1 acetyl-CoA synthetase [Paenibacillus cellulosilyticus]QKS45991.1 AMP-binding protein [Paenibacillus cellulosilyticus]